MNNYELLESTYNDLAESQKAYFLGEKIKEGLTNSCFMDITPNEPLSVKATEGANLDKCQAECIILAKLFKANVYLWHNSISYIISPKETIIEL